MRRKRWLLIVIGILLIIGVGGKVYMDKREEKKNERIETETIEAEKMSVIALKNTFEDIKSVEFEKSAYNKMTGYYSMLVKMTNIDGEYVRFDYVFATNHPNEIDAWGVIDKERIQKEGKTKSEVEVTYSNGNEEEV